MRNYNKEIKELTSNEAYKIYGNPLPKEIQDRLDIELNSIIANGFSVVYMIIKKLVDKSIEYGHFVGNRGCIGSSFVAYLLGITECNPLPQKYGGFNIPFEVFAGIDFNKTLDISLNISKEIHRKMCKYLDKLLKQEGFCITASGDIEKRNGIYNFKRNIVTKTGKQLAYISLISHDLQKQFNGLYNLTYVNPKIIPLQEKNTLDFIISNELYLGSTYEMIKSKITTFEDLVRIYNLIHGTGIWENNVKDIINNGEADLSQVITSRDDIMVYLIEKGIDRVTAYDIMENVRKGKGLTKEMETTMLNYDIPEWYIKSCKKIKYLFPKAHAVGYTILFFRLAWYENHFTKEFQDVQINIK